MNVSVVTERRTPAYSSLAAGELNGLVARALLTEARLTPKPGLVDIRNSGAHRDMDLAAFERSTTAIAPWMEKFFIMGNNTAALAAENVLVMLRPLGMACENDMLQATNGVNTHRGAIFAFGLLWPTSRAGRTVGAKSYLRPSCPPESEYCCPRALSKKSGKTDKE